MPDDQTDFTYEPIAFNTNQDFPEIHHSNSHIDSTFSAYYRSHLYTPHTIHNTLLTSAWPVISSTMRCHEIPLTNASIQNMDTLLAHELKAFESQARKYGHHTTTILAARYCLCAYIDDQFRRCELDNYRSSEHSFLEYYHQTTLDHEQTHLIVSRCQQHAYEFTDLMALIYILYRIGFEGRGRQSIDNYKALLSKADQLFQQIFMLKEHKRPSLNIQTETETVNWSEQAHPARRTYRLGHSMLPALAGASVVSAIIVAGLWLL